MVRSQGFSLLEMLVVVLIVGLFSTLVVARLDGGQAPLRQALEQLASEVRIQAAQARHGGQLLGLRWNGRTPELVRLQVINGQSVWQVEPWRSVPWPPQLQADWPVTREPPVVFTPSGLAGPVSLTWHWPQGSQRWQWRADNSLEITSPP